jgi:cytoskeleton protein RodZ
MTEGAATGAGALLRAARERHGLHLAALAAQLKVAPRKLEALEADRYDELPDATFARALAASVCRTLKIDPAPVLERLPQARGAGLAQASTGLNAPYRERAGRPEAADRGPNRHPLLWAGLLLVVLAAALLVLPDGWWSSWWPAGASSTAAQAPSTVVTEMPASQPAAAASEAAAPADRASAQPGASAPAVEVVQAATGAGESAGDGPAGLAVLRATEASWVEAVDADGQVLVQRTLQPGESVGLNGRLPMKLRIGNAAATQLSLRGQPVDLGPSTRDNIARLELK